MSEYFHNANTKSDRAGSIAPLKAKHAVYNGQTIVIKRYAAHDAYQGAHTFERRGGLTGGPTSHLGVIPQAFIR